MNIHHWHFWPDAHGDYTPCGENVEHVDTFLSAKNMFPMAFLNPAFTFCTACQEVATLHLLAGTKL